MSEWQSIETAPKDGTLIDVWFESHGLSSRDSDETVPCVGFRAEEAMWFSGEWCDMDGNRHPSLDGYTNVIATHWMPLPEPPK